MQYVKILIVDDEVIVRNGMTSLLRWEEYGFKITGSCADGKEALDMIERELPNVVLTDIVMPNMNGIELIEVIKKRYPFIKVIVLSCHSDYLYVKQAMKLGAEDYILKLSLKPAELVEMLQKVADTKQNHHSYSDNSKENYWNMILEGYDDEFVYKQLAQKSLGLFEKEKAVVFIKIHRYCLVINKKILENELFNLLKAYFKEKEKWIVLRYLEG